jgi:hypothetical protein
MLQNAIFYSISGSKRTKAQAESTSVKFRMRNVMA